MKSTTPKANAGSRPPRPPPPARTPLYGLDSSQGLASNQIHRIVLDQQSRLWIASPTGAARYDGSRVDLIDKRQGLNCNGLRCVAIDAAGSVWAGTDLGLDRVDERGNAMPGIDQAVWRYGLCQCLDVSGRELWAGTALGLLRLAPDKNGAGYIVDFSADIGFVNDVLRLDQSIVLAASAGEGLIQSDGRSWWNYRCDPLPGLSISRLARGPDSELLVGTNAGLLVVDLDDATVSARIGSRRPDPQVTAICVADHHYWVAFGAELWAYERLDGEFRAVEHYVLDSPINDLLWDHFDNLWIATNNSGLAVVSCLRKAIEPVELGRKGGVFVIKSRGPQSCWIGGENLLTRLRWVGEAPPTVIDVTRGLPETTIWDCAETEEGVWAATQAGLFLAPHGESFMRMYADHSVLGAACRVLMPRADGLWVGSLRGLVRIHADGAEVIKGGGAALGYIYAMQQDQNGALWIGTLGRGLWCEDGQLTQICGGGLTTDGNTYAASVGPDNSLLVVQDEKVIAVDSRRQPRTVISLPPVAGWCAIWIDESTAAIGASDGLRIIDLQNNRVVRHIRSLLRARNWEFTNNRSLLHRESGTLLCGLNSGLVEVNLDKLRDFLTPPRCQLAEVSWRGIEPEAGPQGYRLRPGRWTLTARAFSAWFVEINALKFQFQLIGFDDHWTEPDARPEITYTSLPIGQYRLLVRASSPLVGVGPETELLQIEVTRPWWAMGWTAALASFDAMYTRLVRSRMRNRQLLERNVELEHAVAERTESLAHANRELQSMRDSYKALSEVDELTQLGNRRSFDKEMQRALALTRRLQMPLALLIADADHFKAVNDRLGHPVGDDYLRAMGKVLRESVRLGEDVATRFGGEEFALLLVNTDLAGALAKAERIREQIAELGLPNVGAPEGKFTVSIGVAVVLPNQTMAPPALIAAADKALYEAKRSGRNRVAAAPSAAAA